MKKRAKRDDPTRRDRLNRLFGMCVVINELWRGRKLVKRFLLFAARQAALEGDLRSWRNLTRRLIITSTRGRGRPRQKADMSTADLLKQAQSLGRKQLARLCDCSLSTIDRKLKALRINSDSD